MSTGKVRLEGLKTGTFPKNSANLPENNKGNLTFENQNNIIKLCVEDVDGEGATGYLEDGHTSELLGEFACRKITRAI